MKYLEKIGILHSPPKVVNSVDHKKNRVGWATLFCPRNFYVVDAFMGGQKNAAHPCQLENEGCQKINYSGMSMK